MKSILTALAWFIISSSTLLALPVDNPLLPGLYRNGVFWNQDCTKNSADCKPLLWKGFSFRFGYYGDFVFDRHLRIQTKKNHSTIHRTTINTNAAYYAFNFCERFDLFGSLGATQTNFVVTGKSLGNPLLNRWVYIDTETTFSWSLGGRGALLQLGCLGIGVEAQYFRTCARLNSISSAGLDTFYYVKKGRPRFHEWQVGLGAAYRITIATSSALIPYLAVKWAQCGFDADDLQSNDPNPNHRFTVFNMENDRSWGYAIGVSLLGYKKATVTVEGRYHSEKAVYVNGTVRF